MDSRWIANGFLRIPKEALTPGVASRLATPGVRAPLRNPQMGENAAQLHGRRPGGGVWSAQERRSRTRAGVNALSEALTPGVASRPATPGVRAPIDS